MYELFMLALSKEGLKNLFLYSKLWFQDWGNYNSGWKNRQRTKCCQNRQS